MSSLLSVFEKLLNKNQVFLKSRSRAFFPAPALLKKRAAPTSSGSGSPALNNTLCFWILDNLFSGIAKTCIFSDFCQIKDAHFCQKIALLNSFTLERCKVCTCTTF